MDEVISKNGSSVFDRDACTRVEGVREPRFLLAKSEPVQAPAYYSLHGLREHWQVQTTGDTPVTVQLLEFDRSQFDTRAFGQCELTAPTNIARSAQSRQADFFFGRLAARFALAQHGHARYQIAVGPNREPVWPEGIIGSITHCRSYAAAVALPAKSLGGIGIDIEAAVAPDLVASVEEMVLLPAERALLHSMPNPYPLLLAAVFSAKESFYKAVSAAAGGYFGFDVLNVDHIDINAGCIEFTLTETVCFAWPGGSRGKLGLQKLGDDSVFTHFIW